MGIRDYLAKGGAILVGGFGDRAMIGFLMVMLNGVSSEDFYLCIKENRELIAGVSDEDWEEYASLAAQAKLGDITTEDVLKEFRKYHPDFVRILVNQPGGMEWLDAQVANIKAKLGLG